MTALLEIRERIKQVYSKFEIVILPVAKFLLAFIVLNTLNGRLGYMAQLNNIALVLIVALLCSFLPTGMLLLFGTLFSLGHMYALSLEVALVGLCVYLVMYLLFFRYSGKDSLVVVVTPLLCAFKIPYVVPIVVGLVCGPASIVSVGCGVFVYYFMEMVIGSAPNISVMDDEDILAKVRLLIEGMMDNRAMLVVIASFAVTVLAVYFLRRLSVNHSWTIAMVAGAMIEVMVLLVGDLMYDINISVSGALFGSLLAVGVAKIVEFFRFCVDYNRTERVQFEDDEYYYYVKAVPKMTVPVSTKTVKKINSQKEPAQAAGGGVSRPAGKTSGKGAAPRRKGNGKGVAAPPSHSRPKSRNGEGRYGRSVVVDSSAGDDVSGNPSGGMTDEFEEWQ